MTPFAQTSAESSLQFAALMSAPPTRRHTFKGNAHTLWCAFDCRVEELFWQGHGRVEQSITDRQIKAWWHLEIYAPFFFFFFFLPLIQRDRTCFLSRAYFIIHKVPRFFPCHRSAPLFFYFFIFFFNEELSASICALTWNSDVLSQSNCSWLSSEINKIRSFCGCADFTHFHTFISVLIKRRPNRRLQWKRGNGQTLHTLPPSLPPLLFKHTFNLWQEWVKER